MRVEGYVYSGTGGESLQFYHNGHAFSTFDNDNENKCAAKNQGGWWYNNCWASNLNGLNHKITNADKTGIGWMTFGGWTSSLEYTYMAIRPLNTGKGQMKHFLQLDM